MPLPRGKKSRPTIFSRTDDFPDDCDPTTTLQLLSVRIHMKVGCCALTIWGRSRESLPIVLKTRSWSLLTMLRRSSPRLAMLAVPHLSESMRDAEDSVASASAKTGLPRCQEPQLRIFPIWDYARRCTPHKPARQNNNPFKATERRENVYAVELCRRQSDTGQWHRCCASVGFGPRAVPSGRTFDVLWRHWTASPQRARD